MGSVNKVMLVGNVGQNPQVRSLSDGTKVCTISVATTQRGYTRRDGSTVDPRTDWHNVVLWRKNAEVAEKYIKKGTQIHVEGELRNRSWEDNEGNKRYVTEVMASRITLLGSSDKTVSEAPTKSDAPAQTKTEHQQPFEGQTQDNADDLPF